MVLHEGKSVFVNEVTLGPQSRVSLTSRHNWSMQTGFPVFLFVFILLYSFLKNEHEDGQVEK